MSKILDKNNSNSPPVHASPLFDPVVGSKAERRERKRKINVAELFGVGKKKPKLEDVLTKVEQEEEERDGKEEKQRDDNTANGGSLKIVMENDGYKCPIEGCGKCFRKENLAQMHIKHYHPEYTKFIGSTPNVADLAYARTVGESIEDVVLKAKTSPSVEKEKTVRADQSSKPKIKTVTSKSTTKLEELSSDIASLPPTSLGKDSEIIKLLNSEPKSNELLPSSEIEGVDELMTKKLNNQHKVSSFSHSVPQNKYPVIKLEDLLRNSPSQFKKEEGRPGGIKTLLPVIRSKDAHRTTEIENEMDVIHNKAYKIHRHKISSDDDIKRRCRLLRSDSEELSNESTETSKLVDKSKICISNNESLTRRKSYKGDIDVSDCCEIDSRSLDSFKTRPNSEANLTACLTNNTQESPKVIIEEGEIIRLVHMRSEEIINCTCGITEEDGLMIQCELCLCWQHGHCHNIEKESQVPEKYICVICKNPKNLRQSQKHIHDQDWLKAGVLTSANFHATDEEKSKTLFEKLRKSHEVTACLMETKEFLHNLKVKLAIAKNINHPKLYLWARPWTRQLSQGTLRLDLKQSILRNYESDSYTNNFDVDHSCISSNSLQNKTGECNIESILSFSPNKKIESEKELISILEGDNEGKQTERNENMTSNFGRKIKVGNIDLNHKKHDCFRISNLSADIPEDIENVPQKNKGVQLSINRDLNRKGISSGIPEPEAAIQSRDCQKNLLEHIDYYQNLVEERLNIIEQALRSIEDNTNNESISVLAVHMMMQDLQRLQYLAKMARQSSDLTI